MSTQSPRREPTFVEKREGDTLINAIIGAVASVVLSFTGVGLILGGAIAGYLQNRGGGAGAKVGAISGLLAAIPAFLLISIVFGSIGMFGVGMGEMGVGAFFGGFAIFILVFVVVILVAMGALGGFIGGALAGNQRRGGGRGRGQDYGRQGGVDEGWNEPRDDRGRDDRSRDDRGRDDYDDRDRDRGDDRGQY